jgi:hypothetical protein
MHIRKISIQNKITFEVLKINMGDKFFLFILIELFFEQKNYKSMF